MLRTVGIALIVTLSTLGGYASLTPWLDGEVEVSPGETPLDDAAPALLDQVAAEQGSPLAQGNGGGRRGATVTISNNMPGTVSIVTRPDERYYRIPWGGGELSLGTTPISSFTLVYDDPFWPYVYEVTCPATNRCHTIRMSDLWHGRVPVGFQLRRGRPDDSAGGIVWFDTTSTTPPMPDPQPAQPPSSRRSDAHGVVTEGFCPES